VVTEISKIPCWYLLSFWRLS